MANQLAPHEVLITHPKAARPLTVLYSAFLAGKYPGFEIKDKPAKQVDAHNVKERGLAVVGDDGRPLPKASTSTASTTKKEG